jgi:uncharacterized damage-inducible protein DinB
MQDASLDVIRTAFGDIENELKATRRLLAALPEGHLGYKPSDKAWTFGALAQHVAQIPFLLTAAVRQDVLDFATVPRQEPPKSMQDVVSLFDASAAEARAAIAELTVADLTRPWTFRFGEQVIFTRPKSEVLREFCISHMIHHRAQLTIYLRLLNVRVPGMYGPTADDA